jgi:hypothetical protein
VADLVGHETLEEGRRTLEVVAIASGTHWMLYPSDALAAKVGLGVLANRSGAIHDLVTRMVGHGLDCALERRKGEHHDDGTCGGGGGLRGGGA